MSELSSAAPPPKKIMYSIEQAGIRLKQGAYIPGKKGYSPYYIRKLVSSGKLEVARRDSRRRIELISERAILVHEERERQNAQIL